MRNLKPTSSGFGQNYIDLVYKIEEFSDIVTNDYNKELTHADITYYHIFTLWNTIGLPEGTTNLDINHSEYNIE